ncbi:MAG: zinc ribbon domain-containing protein [Candidatus Asgardarchaeum sp.]
MHNTWAKLSPNGQYRTLKCKKCGLEADRDVIGACNIRLRG